MEYFAGNIVCQSYQCLLYTVGICPHCNTPRCDTVIMQTIMAPQILTAEGGGKIVAIFINNVDVF